MSRIFVKLKKLANDGKPFLDADGNEVIKDFDPVNADRLMKIKNSKWELVEDPRLEDQAPKASREEVVAEEAPAEAPAEEQEEAPAEEEAPKKKPGRPRKNS